MADNQQPGLLANILAVAGFIILILIIVWGAYNLLKLTGVGFSNIFSRFTGGDIAITAPETAESNAAFPLSWEYTPKEEGTYALLYQCEESLTIDMQANDGPVAAIPCGSSYGVGTLTSVSLTPKLTGTESVEVPLTIIFLPAATTSDARAEGNATITVAPKAGEEPVVVTAPEPATPAQPAQPKPSSGTPDLSVQIIAVGVIDPVSGAFLQRAPVNSNEIAAVQFDILNKGSAASGSYRFNVQLPTQPVYPYISGPQASLTPGSHVVSTLRFGPIAPGGGTISVEVDSQRTVKDASRSNNTAAVYLNAPTYPYYYQAPFVY